MADGVNGILENTQSLMSKAIQHLEAELVKIRAGKANPTMLDGINADYYGNPTPINQVANVTVLDSRTIAVQPWEKNMLAVIEKAIIAANIGINPQNDGTFIRLFLPPLTEERRKELVKRCNTEGEQAKVSIRNIRRDAIEQIKKLLKDAVVSEDASKDAENEVQSGTDKFISLVEKHLAAKEKEIMAV
ncbi:MAG: ribosome recycling factor [Chitinophagaceae bacterium]|jgi:ribosome recycling factor|nr:ribosome recycling factor [Chitinophagaceae bacterium]MBP6047509.1 ribosome recycling factor [Ferruginibacter sp.]NMD29677.1 ribosome recycling factor [Bacteroidota bacterium]MBK7088742.1 ribosome recycling factor [Chitinophagaceae bacterium]MBK7348072.1 ribosome recycling factor [Chitinophagaceae bacterium]